MMKNKRIVSFVLTVALIFSLLPLNIIESFALAVPKVNAANTADGVKVSWNAISSAKGYNVYRKTGTGKYSKIKTVTATNYTDATAKSGTTYTYAVRAYNASVSSDYTEKTILFLDDPTITVANTTAGTVIKWKAVGGAKGYYVYKKTGDGSYSLISTQTALSFTDTSVKNNTKYTYAVRAYNGKTKSSYIGKSNIFLDYPKVTVANEGAGVTTKWAKITGAKGYYVYRKTEDGAYSKIATTTALSYTDKNAVDGTKYTYCARAYSGNYMSSYAGKSLIRLSNPAVTVVNDTSAVRVSWTKNREADGYYVYKKAAGSSYTKIATVNGSSYTDSDVVSGNKYTYTVRAYKGKSMSSYTGKDIIYLAYNNVSVSANDSGAVLKWNAVKGAAGYNIYRRTDSDAYVKIATVTATNYTDIDIIFGANTQYKVLAYKENYEGKSNIVSLIYTSNKGQRFEKQMLQAINEYREAQDIESEYQWNDDIASFAAIRSQELSQDYSHMRPNGELWDDVLGDYPCLKASEIIYKTPSASCSPYAVLSALKNDKSSKEKILDYQYTDFATNLYYDETNGNYYIDMIFIY